MPRDPTPLVRQGRRFIGGGHGRVRKLLYMAALSAVSRLRERGTLTAVMPKLIVLANTLLKEDRQWTPPPFCPNAET